MDKELDHVIKMITAFFAFACLFWLSSALNARAFRRPSWFWPFPFFLSMLHGAALVVIFALMRHKVMEVSTGVITVLFAGVGWISGEKFSKVLYNRLAKKSQ